MKNNDNLNAVLGSTIFIQMNDLTKEDILNILSVEEMKLYDSVLYDLIIGKESYFPTPLKGEIDNILKLIKENHNSLILSLTFGDERGIESHLFALGFLGHTKVKVTSITGFSLGNIEFVLDFSGLINLKTFNVKNLKISEEQNDFGSGIFRDCYSLVDIGMIDTSNMITMESMFENCVSLETVPCFNISNVANMNHMFLGCISLKAIPYFDTSNVEDTIGMFENCISLKTLPNLDLSNVSHAVKMFMNCTNLEKFESDISDIEYMAYMFYNTAIHDSDNLYQLDNCIDANSMFAYCNNICDASDITLNTIQRTTHMFLACESLAKIPFKICLPSCQSVKDVDLMFGYCRNIIHNEDLPDVFINNEKIYKKIIYGKL